MQLATKNTLSVIGLGLIAEDLSETVPFEAIPQAILDQFEFVNYDVEHRLVDLWRNKFS